MGGAVHSLAIILRAPAGTVDVDVVGVQAQGASFHSIRHLPIQHADTWNKEGHCFGCLWPAGPAQKRAELEGTPHLQSWHCRPRPHHRCHCWPPRPLRPHTECHACNGQKRLRPCLPKEGGQFRNAINEQTTPSSGQSEPARVQIRDKCDPRKGLGGGSCMEAPHPSAHSRPCA